MIHAEINAIPMNQKLRSENTYEYVYKYSYTCKCYGQYYDCLPVHVDDATPAYDDASLTRLYDLEEYESHRRYCPWRTLLGALLLRRR